MLPQTEKGLSDKPENTKHERIDPEAFRVICQLVAYECTANQIIKLLGHQRPVRIRSIIKHLRDQSERAGKREMRPVYSKEFFTDYPNRMVSGYVLYSIYTTIRKMYRDQGRNVTEPLTQAKIYLDAYTSFLKSEGKTVATTEIKFNRMINLVNFCESGWFKLKTCKHCGSGYLKDENDLPDAECHSCRYEKIYFCGCGRPIDSRRTLRGRRPEGEPECDVCQEAKRHPKLSILRPRD